MIATRAEKTVRLAAAKAPMTIRKQNRGHPSKRKSFKAWTVSQLLETYRDPRAILLEIASMDTAKLAEEMKGTLADALAERRLCAQAVLPYVAQKLPVQVDMRHTRAIHLNIVDERQYQDLVEVAATQDDDPNTFSMALIPAAPSEDAPGGDRPADAAPQATPPSPPSPQRDIQWDVVQGDGGAQQRAIGWDISPGNKGMQRKNVTRIDAVTPPADDDHVG